MELRIVLQKDGQTALLWQATLDGDHLYAGSAKQGEHEAFRFSYHKDGKTHFYIGGSRIVTGRKPKLTEVVGMQRLPSWNPRVVAWGYIPKPDTAIRRTLALELGRPATISLWAVESGFSTQPVTDVLKQKPYSYRSCEVVGTAAADWTNPQFVAVAWRVEAGFEAHVATQIGPEFWRPTPGSYMFVDRVFYHYHPTTGLNFVKLPDP